MYKIDSSKEKSLQVILSIEAHNKLWAIHFQEKQLKKKGERLYMHELVEDMIHAYHAAYFKSDF